ncbi:MAG: NAD-dependent malic enzyme [Gammaproteobacteria bacterium]
MKSLWQIPSIDHPQPVSRRGYDLIRDPLLNKGSAFPQDERLEFGLDGLLPTRVNTMEDQATRFCQFLRRLTEPMNKYVELAELHDRNENLFYRVLMDDLENLMPIVYTPTVGEATRQFSHVFRRGRGVWVSPEHRGRIEDILRDGTVGRDIRLMVVTDSESILGIGDQGAGGMAISIGKLSLYCAGAGIPPANTLPVCLDVGTNNVSLLDDNLYLGWPHRRLSGDAYFEFIEEFVEAVAEVFPHALLQWEDFRKSNAATILQSYRDRLLSFNDDIQGTGAVALAGILAAMRRCGGDLRKQRFVIHGAGAAGFGIARQIESAVNAAGGGEFPVACLDSRGLLIEDGGFADSYKAELAWPADLARKFDLYEPANRQLGHVVESFRPTVLIGTSGTPGAFDRNIVETMAEHCEHPVIMPFSNPTDFAEGRPEEIIRWSKGRALVATGSPFADVDYEGRHYRIGQGNNVFVFPGLGLGSLLCGASRITDAMITAASGALAGEVSEEELADGMLYPAISRLRPVSRVVAAAVMAQAGEDCVGQRLDEAEIEARLTAASWDPVYPRYVPA